MVTARLVAGQAGPGPVLVCAHGMEDGWRNWIPMARLLAGRLYDLTNLPWRVYALDLPWHTGGSYCWRRESTASAHVAAGLAQLADAGIPANILVGHSFGATAMLEVLAGRHDAGRQLAHLAAAVLISPYYCPPDLQASWALFEESRRHFGQIIGTGLPAYLKGRADAVDDDLRDMMVDKIISRIGPLGFMALFDEFTASATIPLHDVTVPTLILGGSSDPGLAGGRATALSRAMPGATLTLLHSYDHFCHVSQVSDVASRIAGFVSAAYLMALGLSW